jgi:hypothetical protein
LLSINDAKFQKKNSSYFAVQSNNMCWLNNYFGDDVGEAGCKIAANGTGVYEVVAFEKRPLQLTTKAK